MQCEVDYKGNFFKLSSRLNACDLHKAMAITFCFYSETCDLIYLELSIPYIKLPRKEKRGDGGTTT